MTISVLICLIALTVIGCDGPKVEVICTQDGHVSKFSCSNCGAYYVDQASIGCSHKFPKGTPNDPQA